MRHPEKLLVLLFSLVLRVLSIVWSAHIDIARNLFMRRPNGGKVQAVKRN